ncbi:MAG: glycosyltransferase [Terriglobales bacterium]
MTLALAMIVRDAEASLAACLASVSGLVDEIVIADTGSRDGTKALARRLGARLLDVNWDDDFALARNSGLAAVASDWVLVLDADEQLDCTGAGGHADAEAARRHWRHQLTAGPDAFQVTIRNYVPSLQQRLWDRPAQPNDGRWPAARAFPAFVEHQNVRLFRRCPELYFVGRVHESVGPRVAAAGLRLGEARGRIHHFGLALEPEAIARKNRFYHGLCRRKAAEMPGDAQAQFELGLMEFDNFHNDGAALAAFERACRLQPGFALAWFFAGATLLRLGHAAEAHAFFEQAAARGCRSAALDELHGDALYNLGEFRQAAAQFGRAQRATPGSAVLGSKRGLAQLRAGERAAGLARLRQAAAAEPRRADHHDRLVAALVWCGELDAAVTAQRQRIASVPGDEAAQARLAALEQAAAQPAPPPGHVLPLKPPGAGADRNA